MVWSQLGGCTAQLLLATNFNNVPHDEAPWINLIGPARIILRDCVRDEGFGGVVVRNGTLLAKFDSLLLLGKPTIGGNSVLIRFDRTP